MTKLSASRLNGLEKSTQKYESNLSEVWPYLESRGLTEETAKRFRLGYVDEPTRGDEDFQGRLCIPYIRQVGVVAQRFRTLGNSDRKYLGRVGIETGLFHVEAFFSDTDTCVITEGEIDTIVLAQIGIPSVGVAGASGWKQHYTRLFCDFARVIVFNDNDDAGKKFARSVIKGLADTRTLVIPATMPSKDVNETYLAPEYGEEWLQQTFQECCAA